MVRRIEKQNLRRGDDERPFEPPAALGHAFFEALAKAPCGSCRAGAARRSRSSAPGPGRADQGRLVAGSDRRRPARRAGRCRSKLRRRRAPQRPAPPAPAGVERASAEDGPHENRPIVSPNDPRAPESQRSASALEIIREICGGFIIASALEWLERFHIDGLRVDAVASMLYRDYSRKSGEWLPNQYGGRENLESVAFLRELNQIVAERVPGALHWPRNRLPGRA